MGHEMQRHPALRAIEGSLALAVHVTDCLETDTTQR